MPYYHYIAYSSDKKIVTGNIDITSESLAEEALDQMGLSILSLKKHAPRLSLDILFPSVFGTKSEHVIAFSHQLAILLSAGIPLSSALRLLEEQAPNVAFQNVLAGLAKALQKGMSFSGALAKYPNVFPDMFCRIVATGEQSGNLPDAIRQAVSYMERNKVAMNKVRRAMMYPIFLIALASVVVFLLITVAMPPLLKMFDELGAQLPWTTRLLIASTSLIVDFKFLIAGIVVILATAIIVGIRQPAGRLLWDHLMIKLPAIGAITVEMNMALFCRTTSLLLVAGITLPQIMDIVYRTTGNRVVRRGLRDVHNGLIQGRGLAKPMAMNKLFPSLLIQMVMVGEQTGTMDTNLAALADYYENQVNKKIDGLIAMLEPCITITMGLIVGFIALSVIMPLYSVMGSLK